MADDTADEVKVFRVNDAEDLETTAQSADQLDEDKKEVALETELETRPSISDNLLGGLGKGAFKAAAPASPSFMGLGMGAFSPSFGMPMGFGLNPWSLMGGPAAAAAAYSQAARMSPSFMGMPFIPAAALSPSFAQMNAMYNMHMLTSPGSPLAHMAAAKHAQIPLPANMRAGNPLNQMNNMRLNYNPMQAMNNLQQQTTPKRRSTEDKKQLPHIKKPLNAFMWYMKENRPKLMEELNYKEKQSAELNKELGRRWHSLNKEEQQRYFDLAKKDREDHKAKYPGWSARENYAVHKKKKRRREKTEDMGEFKKCRARFGINHQELWCKFCKRKKKCEYSMERSASSTTEGSISSGEHLLGSMKDENMDTTLTKRSKLDEEVDIDDELLDDEGVSDSESDIDECDDPTLTQQALNEVALQQDAFA